jgi:Fe2+ transport system protein FeoA
MSGPVEVRLRGCNLALGRGIADKIYVEPDGAAA